MVATLSPINPLPCPETACYQVVEKDGVRCVSYAVRESGEALWGAFATIVDGDLIIGEVEFSGAYKDPRVAVLDARQHLTDGIRKELLGAQPDMFLRLLKGGTCMNQEERTMIVSIPMKDTRAIGTPLQGSVFRLSTGNDKQVVARHYWMDQDIDGSWCVWGDRVGPGEHDDRPPEGSISIYDPAVAAFLEQLHALLEDPIAFGHQDIGEQPA